MRARTAERLIVLIFGAAILVASQLPALWAWRAHRRGDYPHLVFTGALYTYADDTQSYSTWMDQAREGRFAFRDRFTLDEHPRDYVNVLFGALGWISRLTGAPVIAVYTLSRPAVGAVLLLLLYLLAARLFSPVERVACFACFVLSSGWEALATLVGPALGIAHLSSLVWWSPEVNIENLCVVDSHRLEQTVAEQKTAIGYRDMRLFRHEIRPFCHTRIIGADVAEKIAKHPMAMLA